MKTLQEQFYENALQRKEFTLAVENGETLHYASTQNRDLTLYYEYRERDRNASYWTAIYNVKNIPLIAIVVGERVLIVDRYRDPILFEEKAYPDNMYDIDTYKEEIEKKIQEILKMEYEELPIEVIDEDSEIMKPCTRFIQNIQQIRKRGIQAFCNLASLNLSTR